MLTSFIVTASLSAILILFLIQKASRVGMVAIPNERSAHTKATPCGAGIAFITAALIGLAVNDLSVFSANLPTILAIVMVFVLGVFDDYKHSSSNLKFMVILLAAILLLADGLEIRTIGSYFGHDIALGLFAIPVTLIAVVGFTNALNLVDGLDGLAATLTLIIISGIAYIGFVHKDFFIINISVVLFAALIVFLIFNWNPAKIFMGDSGSLTLGFIIAVLSIKALAYIDPVSILFITALPIIDTVTVMLRRKLNGRSMVSADKNHLHHILQDTFNGNVKKTVLSLAGLQFVFTLFGILVAPSLGQEITLTFFLLTILGIYWFVEVLFRKTNRGMFTSSS